MVQVAIMCQRLHERSDGAGAVLTFELDGREVQAQVLDCSAKGLSIGLSEQIIADTAREVDATLSWRQASVPGRLLIRHVTSSYTKGSVAGGEWLPENERQYLGVLERMRTSKQKED